MARFFCWSNEVRRDPIDIADVEDLYSRLRLAPREAWLLVLDVGLHVERPGSSEATAKRRVGHEILLFEPYEVTALMHRLEWS